jgi:hypothetical protein
MGTTGASAPDDEGRVSPKTEAELFDYIHQQLTTMDGMPMPAAYDRGPEIMWRCALATFDYVAHAIGATGFQASWADLQFIKHSRHYDGPFAVIDGRDMLYPQYDILAKVRGYLEEWQPWAAEEARHKLDERDAATVSRRVVQHWKKLAQEGRS